MKLPEACEYLRISPQTMYRLLARGVSIPGMFKVGSDYRFRRQGLDEFMDQGGTEVIAGEGKK